LQWSDIQFRNYNFFCQGETPGSSKITKGNYKICLVVNSEPTLAGRHQRNHQIIIKEVQIIVTLSAALYRVYDKNNEQQKQSSRVSIPN